MVTQRVLFFRDFRRFHGGHLKIWEYYNHVNALEGFRSRIYCSPQTVWSELNPWFGCREETLGKWDPQDADLYFLGGKDWLQLTPEQWKAPSRPIINLIQHVRHADPEDALFKFLDRPAIRICVGPEVADQIISTGRVHGPVFTIPNGLNRAALPASLPREQREIPLLICGLKAPRFAKQIQRQLSGRGVASKCLVDPLPRAEFLSVLANSRAALVLPRPTEGWFLPALEAMALATPMVCPDCVGNRSFCIDQVNCWRPPYQQAAILSAVEEMLAANPEKVREIQSASQQTAIAHDLSVERAQFLAILSQAHDLWNRIR